MTTATKSRAVRRTQADRRARTRSAILEAATRGLSRHGYANLVLEDVARDAGYTRGALYHLFASKEELALAVLEWVDETWYLDVGRLAREAANPVDALVAVARGHAVFCRRDLARSMMALRIEFGGQDNPVGRAVDAGMARLIGGTARLVAAARREGLIPPGPPPRAMALAHLGAVEGLVINLAGQAPFDVELVERAVRGLLGLAPSAGLIRSTSREPRRQRRDREAT